MLKRTFTALLAWFAAFFLVFVLTASARAPLWKPERTVGSSQFAVSELLYLERPESDSQPLQAAIADFTELFSERYGRDLVVVPPGVSFKRSLGFKHTDSFGLGGGFALARDRTRVTVRATDEAGWVNGLYAIMGDGMGARWYWPGEGGFEWTELGQGRFPDRPSYDYPAFVQRRLHPVDTDYGRRNRLNDVYSFNHNLAKIFTREVFDAQPELFAEVNGRRKPPRGHGGRDPQPDFIHSGAVELAAQAALDHFREHPESTSFSLSINDNVLYDTGAATEAVVSPLRYFRGRPDYTDLVFGFMNRVAERVFNEAGAWETPGGEDRYLTALAYYWTEPAPGFRLHPRVMPVLTSDRAQWHDPSYRSEDKALIRDWTASGAKRVATWDYYFGAPYVYPRQFNRWIAESLTFLADAGVDVFFSQLPAFWGLDGAKAWLAAQLLWDPQQDAEMLLQEYYDNFFGLAAEPMRAFYELAELHRDENEGAAEWIKLYKDEAGIALFTPEVLAEMRTRLSAAATLVEGDLRRKERVGVVSDAFRLTELYANYDRSRRQLVELCVDRAEAPEVEAQLSQFRLERAAYEKYLETYLDLEYAPNRRHIERLQSNPEALAQSVIQGNDTKSFTSLVASPALAHKAYYTRNFLGPELPWLDGWHIDYRPHEGFQVGSSEWGMGHAGLRFTDADIVSVFRSFDVEAEQSYALRMQASWQISLDCRVLLEVAWLDADGRTLLMELPLRLPSGARGSPVDLDIPLYAPEGASAVRLRMVASRLYSGDFLDISKLDFGRLD